ncbi:hypothetical protein GCM10009676_15710 [Prauserella halophila]|uniref:DUF397 domain-containing protein n=1 Tax=Prauserella halophila TaxID=185641 RepID=A0ABN1W2X9_9PSEU|nr:protein of unknown function (DUF397) [Prauserella halophila]
MVGRYLAGRSRPAYRPGNALRTCADWEHDVTTLNADQIRELSWRKSRYSSGGEGNCVEVAKLSGGGVAVRHSQAPEGPAITYTAAEWAAFAQGVARRGRVPRPARLNGTRSSRAHRCVGCAAASVPSWPPSRVR